MHRILLFCLLLTALSQRGFCAEGAAPECSRKVSPPEKISHDNKTLLYNPSWQNQEACIEANLDDDPEKEIIISFVATYTPKPEVTRQSRQPFYTKPKKDLPIIQNYVFYQIYDIGRDGHFTPVKTISGMDRMGNVRIVKLDSNSPNAIVLLSPGGKRYLDLSVYRWREGGYRLLFNRGTSEDIEIDPQQYPPVIRIAKPARDNNRAGRREWEIYRWDSSGNEFKRLTK